MKKGWEYKKLGEVCDFVSGFAFKSNKFTKSGEPIIRISDIHDGIVDDSNVVFFNKETYNVDLSKYIIKPNDILIAMSGGTTGKIGVNTNNRTYYLNQRVGLFREKSLLNHYFLYYFLQTKREESLKVAAGAAQPNLSTAQIKAFEIPVPSLSEQQRIVSYLDAAFAKIDAVAKNAEDSLNEAKALFQSALTKMMEPKEGWSKKNFGGLCTFVRGPFGGSLKKNCFKESGYAVYEQQNAIYNRFSFRYFIDEEKYNSMSRFKVEPGDLIMSCSGTIGKVAIVPKDAKRGIINQALLKLTPSTKIDAEFLKYLMESNFFKGILSLNAGGAAINNIASVSTLKKIELSIPTVEEQREIVKKLNSIKKVFLNISSNLTHTLSECAALKQSILRETFE